MKKSAKVTLIFLSSFAAAVMNSCNKDDDGDWVEAKRCVDNNNVVVVENLCQTSGPHTHYYSHYYGGHGYYVGERAYGGGRMAQATSPAAASVPPAALSSATAVKRASG
jgi:hypothetical protein